MTPFLQLRLRLETTYDYSILDFFPTRQATARSSSATSGK